MFYKYYIYKSRKYDSTVVYLALIPLMILVVIGCIIVIYMFLFKSVASFFDNDLSTVVFAGMTPFRVVLAVVLSFYMLILTGIYLLCDFLALSRHTRITQVVHK